jgi:hypothetical protein
MSTKRITLFLFLALSLVIMPVYSCKPIVQPDVLKVTTSQIQFTAQLWLNALDRDLSAIATQPSGTGLSGTKVTDRFGELTHKYPFVIDYVTTDADGKMVVVVPEAYVDYEGTDISQQPVTVILKDTEKPLLSGMFTSVEGVDAVVIMWPVLSEKGEFLGSVSALFKPEDLFAGISRQGLEGTGIAINVMQLDGLNIYDSEGKDTGKNLFTDPEFQEYPELIEIGHKMVDDASGSGKYIYIDNTTGKTVKKQVFWETVSLHGTDWRVAGVSRAVE